MTDNEIIKALECCIKLTTKCHECPYNEVGEMCFDQAKEDALKLINLQRVEIGRLHNILLSFTQEVHTWSNKHGYDTTELSLIPILNEAEKVRESIEAEAIKEVAEQLKECAYDLRYNDGSTVSVVETHCIDRITKERTKDI